MGLVQPFALATTPLGNTDLLSRTTQLAPTQLNDQAVIGDSD